MGFLIPALVTFAGFALNGVWPFGDGTVLIIDSLHQYLPFYTDLHEKLVHHESLLYSFSAGLGYDFWATFAYYMASPLNFLLVLFPKANVADAMDLFIILKVGLCGGYVPPGICISGIREEGSCRLCSARCLHSAIL